MGNCITTKDEVKNDLIPSHKLKVTNHYTIVYPNHKKRTNSTIYNKTHNELINKIHLNCFVCIRQKMRLN